MHRCMCDGLYEQAAEKEQRAIEIENKNDTRAVIKMRKQEEKEQKQATKKAKVAK